MSTQSARVAIHVPDELEAVSLSFVKPEPVEWLWPNRFAVGKVSIIPGDPGLGKSMVTLDLAARVSAGRPFVDCQHVPNPAGRVIVLTAEDDLADTVRPRLDAAKADCTNVVAIESVLRTDPDTGEKRKSSFVLGRDIETLQRTVVGMAGVRLIIIDPLSAYLGDADSHVNAAIRGLLAPLADMAAELRVAVIAVHHLNKGNGSAKAIYRTSGSLGFVAAARSVYGVTVDPNDPTRRRRLFLPIKNNLASDAAGLAYVIDTDADDQPFVRWLDEPVTMTADEAMAERRPGRPATKVKACAAWLLERLAAGGERSDDLIAEAAQHGYSRNTCWRAKDQAGIKARKSGFGHDGGWVWTLPDPPDEDDDGDDTNTRFP